MRIAGLPWGGDLFCLRRGGCGGRGDRGKPDPEGGSWVDCLKEQKIIHRWEMSRSMAGGRERRKSWGGEESHERGASGLCGSPVKDLDGCLGDG